MGNRNSSQQYNPRSYTSISGGYKKRSNKPHTLKASIMAMQPAKHYSASSLVATLHNNIYALNLTSLVLPGTGNNQRLGDSIRLSAIKLKGFNQTPTTATGMFTYRIMLVWNTAENTSAGLTIGQLADAQIFLPGTASTSGWTANGIVNPKACTVLFDKTFDIPTLVTTTADLVCFNTTVQINQDFDYLAAGSVYGKTRNLYLVAIPCIVGGTPNVTSTGATDISYDIIFK